MSSVVNACFAFCGEAINLLVCLLKQAFAKTRAPQWVQQFSTTTNVGKDLGDRFDVLTSACMLQAESRKSKATPATIQSIRLYGNGTANWHFRQRHSGNGKANNTQLKCFPLVMFVSCSLKKQWTCPCACSKKALLKQERLNGYRSLAWLPMSEKKPPFISTSWPQHACYKVKVAKLRLHQQLYNQSTCKATELRIGTSDKHTLKKASE